MLLLKPIRLLQLSSLVVLATLGVAGTSAWAQSAPPAATSPGVAPASPADSALSPEILYRILVGDIAMQRGDSALAARAYFEAARDAQDARLARRATEVALFARQRGLALESAKLWVALEPGADRARQMVATLTQSGAGNELKAELEHVLAEAATNGTALSDAFMQINQALASQTDKGAVFKLIADLAKPYPNVAEAQFAVALAGYNTGLRDLDTMAMSMRAADRALELKPGWERAALLKSDILSKNSPQGAINFLNGFLASTPESRAASVAVAQLYVEQKRFAEAREVFQRLWAADSSDRELEFAVAALSLQLKDYSTAERLFTELKVAGFGEPGVVNYYLAQVADEARRYDDAIALYREVTTGERAWISKLRIATMMGKKGDVAAARRYLATLAPEDRDQRIERTQTEAQLMRDAGDNAGAYSVLTAALVVNPDSVDLLYDVAMVAEKLDRLEEVETRLSKLIELKPDNAQALNALGYTLVDRTTRTAEGLKLIEQALALSPGDPYILDSMGWAQFRMGNYEDSEKTLRRALAERSDPEIAAHLGEVLWARGERTRAKDLWQSQLKQTPDNPMLLETLRRFVP
ncbi:MAG: tetratricopeptide repeat protein [Casimicrobiaceae bacterium]